MNQRRTAKGALSRNAARNAHAAVYTEWSDGRHEIMERIYNDWDEALSRSDVEGLLALYARDAVLESPLGSHLLGKETGICKGHDELRPFFELLRK